jgi:Icc protein
MPPTLTFAHLTDIHISQSAESWASLGPLAEVLFAKTIDELNAMPALDFVLITGDVLDGATPSEVARFHELIARLEKPWHFVPGNHDGYYDPEEPQALPPHEAVASIDPRLADPPPAAQLAKWSRPIADGVQLIGLDSRISDDWDGVIEPAQLDWLREELIVHRNKMVIIAVHHPLYNLMPLNAEPYWSNFICRNGAEVEALLREFPAVKLVLAGHHHAHQIRARDGFLHVSTAALSSYPCVYRLVTLTEENGAWQAAIETCSPADEAQLGLALEHMMTSRTAELFNPDDRMAWPLFLAGGPDDQSYEGPLP